MTIPELVKAKRLELRESQSEFGKRFGVSHASISDLERGKARYIDNQLVLFIFSDYRPVYKIRCDKCKGLGYIERKG